MKKINIILMSFVAVLCGLLQTACTDNPNDWTVDSSVTRQYPPSSLTVEVDSFSLDLKISVGTLKSATSYEVQVSEKPLIGGIIEETTGIPTYTVDKTGELIIPRVSENFTITEGSKLYLRARAIGENGSKSTWYSNGMVYKDGVIKDEAVADYMKVNASFSVTAPSGLWATNFEETSIQLNWYMLPTSDSKLERAYCGQPSYIINETLKAEGASENLYKKAIEGDDITNYNKVWDNLETGKSYTFTLYDANDVKIGETTASTEFAPNMELAYSATVADLIEKAPFMVKGEPYTVSVTNEKFGTEPVTYTFNNESAGGWTASRNDYASSPDNKALFFDIRAQIKKNASVTINVPANGRLYIYGYGSTENTITQGSGDEKVVQTIKTTSTKQTLPTAADPGVTANAYLSYKVRLTKGEATLKIDAANSLYFYGFCFVPDDPNAKAE